MDSPCGHNANADAPETVNRLLERFAAELPQVLTSAPGTLADDLRGIGDEHEAVRVYFTRILAQLYGLIPVDHGENDRFILMGIGRPLRAASLRHVQGRSR